MIKWKWKCKIYQSAKVRPAMAPTISKIIKVAAMYFFLDFLCSWFA